MVWTGIATDLTLDDVIGPPRDSAPASPLAAVLHAAAPVRRDASREATHSVTPQARAPQPQPYQPRPLSDGGAPARPRPHVSVTEDMLPPRKRMRGYWLLGALVVMIAVLVVGPLSMRATPSSETVPATAPSADAAVDLAAPVADLPSEVPAEWTGAPPKKALLTRPAKKAKPVPHDVDNVEPLREADGDEPAVGAGDISLEKFRQLSGKI